LRSNLICRGIFEDFHAGSKGNLYSKNRDSPQGYNIGHLDTKIFPYYDAHEKCHKNIRTARTNR
jgi:hypothetical protein